MSICANVRKDFPEQIAKWLIICAPPRPAKTVGPAPKRMSGILIVPALPDGRDPPAKSVSHLEISLSLSLSLFGYYNFLPFLPLSLLFSFSKLTSLTVSFLMIYGLVD